MNAKLRKRTRSAAWYGALASLLMGMLSISAWAEQKDWQKVAAKDPVLTALRAELDRSKSHLKMDEVAAPYYIEYRVFDVNVDSAEAAFGALRTDLHMRIRFLRVVVRIGDYKQDSYFGQGEGTFDFMPVDDDPAVMRHQLWLATDRAYKAAAQSLTAKQAQLKQLTVDEPVDDFAHADPVQSIEPLASLEYDSKPWTTMLQDASDVYKSDADIELSEANLSFSAINEYFVNSEGTVLRTGHSLYQMYVTCSSQAVDGMSVTRNNGFVVTDMKELPSAAEFTGRARKLAASLKGLREAPVVDEEYRGPVLFSADASASVFAALVGDNVIAHRPQLGKNARTTGAFASSYKTRVLPEFLSVVEDPTISTYRGQSLLGHYAFDDEGVPAQTVTVIEKGMLVNYVLGREPIRDFPRSNGHSRTPLMATRQPAPGAPAPHTSNLIVTSSEPLSAEALKAKFLDACRQRDLAYCYRVETFGPSLSPRLLYRVYPKDGHEELVRGGSFGDLDTRALRSDLIAAGDDFYVDDRATNVPHSIVAPSTLFDELELKRANVNKEKLPEYPAPALGK